MKAIAIQLAAAAMILAATVSAAGQEPALHGHVQHQLAARYGEQDIVGNSVGAEVDLDYGSAKGALRIIPSFEVEAGSAFTMDLREAYVDLYLPSIDLRVGKQIVVWGKADGITITDIVSPKDLSNFLIPEFRELRLGVIGVRADYFVGPLLIELMYIPIFTPSRLPAPDSIWFSAPEAPVEPTLTDPTPVGRALTDAEIYGRIGLRAAAVDVELYGGHFWSNEPAPLVKKTFSSPGVLSAIDIQPEYYRQTMAGGSVAVALGPLVLRAESGFFTPTRYLTTDMSDSDGYVEKNHLHSLLGADTAVAGINLSAQIAHRYILGHDTALREDEHTFTATFRAGDTMFNDTLSLQMLAYVGLNEPNALLKPSISYTFTDALQLGVEGNIFLGSEGQFGQYNGNDLVVLRTKYSF